MVLYHDRIFAMVKRSCAVVLAATFWSAFASVHAEELARTAGLPPAVAALRIRSVGVLTEAEAARVRGGALDAAGILDAMARIEQRAGTLDGSGVFAAAEQIGQRAEIVELPDRIYAFGGYFFGDGVLINRTSGRGAIFDPANLESGLLLLSDLRGDYTVRRDEQGIRLVAGQP